METQLNPLSTGSSSPQTSAAPNQPSQPSHPEIPAIEREALALKQVEAEIRRVIVGQDYLVERLLVGLLARGHVLIEGVPGLAKTLAAKTLARTLAIDFRRVQFTPDLLPADLVGTLIYDPRKGDRIKERLSLQGNPAVKDDWFKNPKTGETVDFIDFCRSEGRFVKHFDKEGNPSPTLLAGRQDRLENWHVLQELAGVR